MRIAHIIIAHKNPEQLFRLVTKLEHQACDIYIHLDKKVNLSLFSNVQERASVQFIKNRIDINWGGNSLFNGILASLEEVLKSETKYDFINLLSAQDYPLISSEKVYSFLSKHKSTNFISFDESTSTDWWATAFDRFEKYHFTDFSFKGRYFVQRILNALLPTRKFPLAMKLYGSNKSTWWTITGECAIYVNDIFNNKKLRKFLKYSWGTDEFAFATVVMNSPFKTNTINNNLRYIDWSEGNANPKTLTDEDFEALILSKMLYARKFDIDVSETILTKIDAAKI